MVTGFAGSVVVAGFAGSVVAGTIEGRGTLTGAGWLGVAAGVVVGPAAGAGAAASSAWPRKVGAATRSAATAKPITRVFISMIPFPRLVGTVPDWLAPTWETAGSLMLHENPPAAARQAER